MTPNQDIFWTKEFADQPIPAERVDQLYGDTDVYLSLSGGEGFGLPVAEALTWRTPAVLTDHMNHRQVAGDGAEYVPTNGKLYQSLGTELKQADVDAATDIVLDLLDDRERREANGEKGAENVRDFTWDCTAEELSAYLDEHVDA